MKKEAGHDNQLKRSMKSRHLFMLSLGGVIGTGLFLNLGYTINQVGAGGSLIAYLIGGLVLFLVMLCLGELSVYMPVTGSFQAYATKFIGPATGFMLGWMYFIGSATTASVEFTAAGILMKRWFPHTPIWIWCAVFIVILFLLNALTTRGYAEAEYWFSAIKVLAVALFLIIGIGAVFGFVHMNGRPAPHLSNLSSGHLFPAGISIIFMTMINVIFSYQGAEVIGIASGESENPQKDIPKAVRNVVVRILFFYIASVIVLSALFPTKSLGVMKSPFVTLFDSVGIPFAADIMNFIILTAVLSVGNSCLYASTRLLWSLSKTKMAHPVFGKLTKRKVPLNALLITTVFSLLSLLTSFLAPNTVYVLLTSASGISVTIAWMGIALSQYQFRKKFIKDGGNVKDLKFKAPLYPVLPLFCLLVCTITLIFPIFDPAQRTGFFYGIGIMAVCYLYYFIRYKRKNVPVSLPSEKTEETLSD
ncbi:amino acid permease [Scopulibacillus cellulosilyticus]|uniref:Amino acid permease n=1 Tax=Scopulibacillus cellulosilyticus TaxID=2665665 RepID=A0ABW2Q019_9BACL